MVGFLIFRLLGTCCDDIVVALPRNETCCETFLLTVWNNHTIVSLTLLRTT